MAQQAPGAVAVGGLCSFLRRWPRGSGAAFGTDMTRLTTEYEGRRMPVTAAVKRAYAALGWRFHEVVGRLASDALPVAPFSSPRARTILATAQTSGEPIKKSYSQNDTVFLIVKMQRPTGRQGQDADSFALVFSKRRIMPNPQGRANGRQPIRSETSRTPTAAASRR